MEQLNIFGEPIEECCANPITGFFRDGFCRTDEMDRGLHVVCAQMTEDFLEFSKLRGNDLSTPKPEFNFPGLKEGDHWCICAERWKEAFEYDKAPKLFLRKSNQKIFNVKTIFFNEYPSLNLRQSDLLDWIYECVHEKGAKIKRLDINFIPEHKMLDLNKKHLKHDTHTDILTFSYKDHLTIESEIFICFERALENAKTCLLYTSDAADE